MSDSIMKLTREDVLQAGRRRTTEENDEIGRRWLEIDLARSRADAHLFTLQMYELTTHCWQGVIMPNWVTVRLEAPQHVIDALITEDPVGEGSVGKKRRVDFCRILPLPCPHDFEGIYCSAETQVGMACGGEIPRYFSEKPWWGDASVTVRLHPDEAFEEDLARLLASIHSMQEAGNLLNVSHEILDQFVAMLRNYRAVGYLHNMEFARARWGTKWNACETKFIEGGVEFQTAWSCPLGVLEELSRKFPDDVIFVAYADEDLGNNCGEFLLKAGTQYQHNEAPHHKLSPDAEAAWRAFAHMVTGRRPYLDDGLDDDA